MPAEPLFDHAIRLHQRGRLEEAEQAYREILRTEPNHPGAQHLLGVIRHQGGDHETALELIGRAIAIIPTKAIYHNNYGAALLALERYEEALVAFHRALEIRPHYADALSNLGMTEAALGHDKVAISCFRGALEVEPHHRDATTKLAALLHRRGRTDEAIRLWRSVLEREPRDGNIHFNLATAHQELHQIDEAKAHFSRAAELCPDKPLWRFRSMATCPAVFPSADEIDAYRQTLLEAMDTWPQTFPESADWDDIVTAGVIPSLAFSYHGRDNRRLKEKFAALYEPYFAGQPRPNGSGLGDRSRIGFVVTQRHEGIFLRCMRGILENLDRERIEIVVLCSRASLETIRKGIRRDDLCFVPFGDSFQAAVSRIREAACELIYFWEVGTDPMNYFLPLARLAPVQCTSHGSLVTSGVPAVDYFYSSHLMEIDQADGHYTEKLWRSNTLLMHQNRLPPVPPVSPGYFGLPDGQHLYVCFQNPVKLHPDIDPLFGGILEADPRGTIVLLADRQGHVAGLLKERFAHRIPAVAQRIVFLPWQPFDDYCRLVQLADVVLDPPHYGAGSSCYDVFSFDQPMVTMPSQLMPGRVAAAFYKKMQVEDLIATSPSQYVSKAVRVATDRDYRTHVKQRIAQASHVLFDDHEAVREHERFFAEVLACEVR